MIRKSFRHDPENICNPPSFFLSLAARFFLEQKKEEGTRIFWTERIFSFLFWAFLVVPSLSPLETKQHPDQKQEHKTTQQKRKSTFFNRASSFWTLPPVVLFNLSDAFAFVRLFASDSRRKKRALFFLSLSKAPERTRKERDEKRKKKLLFLSLFLIEKAKTSFARVPKKQEEEEEEKKHKQKRRGG